MDCEQVPKMIDFHFLLVLKGRQQPHRIRSHVRRRKSSKTRRRSSSINSFVILRRFFRLHCTPVIWRYRLILIHHRSSHHFSLLMSCFRGLEDTIIPPAIALWWHLDSSHLLPHLLLPSYSIHEQWLWHLHYNTSRYPWSQASNCD